MSGVDTFLAGTGRFHRAAYRAVRTLVAALMRVWTRMEIEGREHIPAEGGFILSPIHRSYIDTPIAATITSRRMLYLGKDTIWKWKPGGWICSTLGAIPVTRGTPDRESLGRSLEVLTRGDGLVLFPEGERKDGPLVQPLFEGAAYLAGKADVPIVPVGIGGSAEVMPRKSKFIYPRKVHVVIGEPVRVERSESGRVPRPAITAATEELHAALQILYDEAQSRVGQPPR